MQAIPTTVIQIVRPLRQQQQIRMFGIRLGGNADKIATMER
jgi:hypothetical protein